MSGQQGQWWQWVQFLVGRFRDKGATTPDRAMTAQELGLHERFEEAMKRRLGQTGIFVETGGKYYLNEEGLRAFEQKRQNGGFSGTRVPRRNAFGLRILRMILGMGIVLLILVNFFAGRSLDVWYLIVVLGVAWICVTVLQISYMARNRY